MSFLKDYLFYNQGNECPENYHIWGALCCLSSVVSMRVHINMGYFNITPNLYVCLVGKQGNRKTVAKDIAYDMLRLADPTIPVSAESMSKEAITQFMAGPDQLRTYQDVATGKLIEYHPFSIFITELKNFLSINPTTMIDFLTTIYDRKFYDVITKNKGTDIIKNPAVVVFACETPDWLIMRLKDSIISGGFCRRMIFVYETGVRVRIPFPSITPEAKAAHDRCVAHLQTLKYINGEMKWDAEAREFYEAWYRTMKMPEDPFMAGYYESKHVQMLKVAILLTLSEGKELVLTKNIIQASLAILDTIEVNLPRLSASVGRNELAHPTTQIIDMLEAAGGSMPEKQVQKMMFKNMSPQEFYSVIQHLVATEQLVLMEQKTNGISRKILMFPDVAKAITAKQASVSKPSEPPVSLPSALTSDLTGATGQPSTQTSSPKD